MKSSNSIASIITVFFISVAPQAMSADYLCSMPGSPAVEDVSDDVAYFLTKSSIWQKGFSIVSARKEMHPISGLTDIKYYFPAPIDTHIFKSDLPTYPSLLTLQWSKRCSTP